MSKKRTFFTVLALVLVCAVSIAGTVAYMSMQGGSVENTFIAAGGGKLADSLTLVEHKVEQQADGSYQLTAETTNKNSYQVMPGMELPKDPTITVNGKTAAAAYLYVEVVDQLDENFTWAMDFNIAMNRNKVTALTNNQYSLMSQVSWDYNYNSQYPYITQVGKPSGMMYGYIYEGTYKTD